MGANGRYLLTHCSTQQDVGGTDMDAGTAAAKSTESIAKTKNMKIPVQRSGKQHRMIVSSAWLCQAHPEQAVQSLHHQTMQCNFPRKPYLQVAGGCGACKGPQNGAAAP